MKQHVVRTSMTSYVPICYEVINLFIESQNFLLMLLISKLKDFYLIIFFFNGLLMLSLDLFNFCIKSTWYDVFQDVLPEHFTLILSRVYNDIHDTKDWEEFIHLVLLIFRSGPRVRGLLTIALISSLWGISWVSSPSTDINIFARPRYCHICALLNQFSPRYQQAPQYP